MFGNKTVIVVFKMIIRIIQLMLIRINECTNPILNDIRVRVTI